MQYQIFHRKTSRDIVKFALRKFSTKQKENKSIAQGENKNRKLEIRYNARHKENSREIKEYFTYVLQEHVRVIIKDAVGTSSIREETQEKM